jgi:hypothetical protein
MTSVEAVDLASTVLALGGIGDNQGSYERWSVRWKNCLTNGPTGNRASVNADTSDHGCPINNGDAIVRFCRTNGSLLSC